MTPPHFLRAASAAGLALVLAAPAFAQKAPAAAAAPAAARPAVNWGTPIAGMCVFSRDQAVATSAAGKSASSQLKTLSDQANAALAPEGQAIKTEQQAIRSQASTLTQPALQQRSQALAERIRAYEANAQTRNRQLQQAQQNALGQMDRQMDQILPGLVSTHRCALVLERSGTYGANPAMDLTAEVVAGLDQRMPSITVSLPAATPAK